MAGTIFLPQFYILILYVIHTMYGSSQLSLENLNAHVKRELHSFKNKTLTSKAKHLRQRTKRSRQKQNCRARLKKTVASKVLRGLLKSTQLLREGLETKRDLLISECSNE